MKERVESLETQLALIKADLVALKTREVELPEWVKNSAGAILLAIFAQTVTTVWWASDLSSRHTVVEKQVDKNTTFIESWPAMHEEVMLSLKEIQIDSRNMKDMLQEIRSRQFGHFKDINGID
jgi:D-mannonate dehydratase